MLNRLNSHGKGLKAKAKAKAGASASACAAGAPCANTGAKSSALEVNAGGARPV